MLLQHKAAVIYGIPDTKILGVPLAELDARQFSQRITAYTTSYFLAARLAARRMIPNESGVIMTVTTLRAGPIRLHGVRQGERDHGNYRQPDHGQPG